MAIQLWTTTGTLTKLSVRLRRGRKLADTVRLGRVSTRKRRVVLRVKGQLPPLGHYMVLVARNGTTLARHAFRVH